MKELYVREYQNCKLQVVNKLAKEFNNKVYEDVEDAYQEAFFVLERKTKQDNFKPENICGYLYIVARNKLKRMPSKNEVDVLKTINIIEQKTFQPLEMNMQEIRLHCLNKALTQLDAKCHNLLKMRYEEFKKLKDVWADLGFPSYDAIKQKNRACKLKLKKLTNICLQQQPA